MVMNNGKWTIQQRIKKLTDKLDEFINLLQRNSAQIAQRDRQPVVFLVEGADGAR